MGERTDIAKALRDDDVQYLKALANGKSAEKHTSRIVGDYRLSYKSDVMYPFFTAVGIGGVCVMLSQGDSLGSGGDLGLIAIGWLCFALLFLHRFCLIRDYRAAEKIYPGINVLLGAHTEFVPTWGYFTVTIFFAVLISILFAVTLYNRWYYFDMLSHIL